MADVIDAHASVVRAALRTSDELDATSSAAANVDEAALVRDAVDSDDLVQGVLRAALATGLSRMRSVVGVVDKHVKEDGAALRTSDPKTVPAVKDEDIAAARAKKLEG